MCETGTTESKGFKTEVRFKRKQAIPHHYKSRTIDMTTMYMQGTVVAQTWNNLLLPGNLPF
jgi:hypothetical protein